METQKVISLDGEWLLSPDPKNNGIENEWFRQPAPEAICTKVPWVIQDVLPDYHGLVWYWRDFIAPGNPYPQGRYFLRFWAVDYKASVWLNDVFVGEHEGAEGMFILDVTHTIKPNRNNRVSVRVLNPIEEAIDGIVVAKTPHRGKAIPYVSTGICINEGGILDSVELLLSPAVRIRDLFVRPDLITGIIHLQVEVQNTGEKSGVGYVETVIAPAAAGEMLKNSSIEQVFNPGENSVQMKLQIDNPHPWDVSDPYLYRVTVRIGEKNSGFFDEHSVRCGFRDFRFENGCFRLNGRRIFLRCSHTGNFFPVGIHQVSCDPDFPRRDLLNVKTMGFNSIRFLAGLATRRQLDLCDEIGLMVYEEPCSSWFLEDSPRMKEYFNRSMIEMIRRDRNHPSIVIWGVLNENFGGPVFHHAVSALALIRDLDPSRVVILNSGRCDGFTDGFASGAAEFKVWRSPMPSDSNLTGNQSRSLISDPGILWAPGLIGLHPGPGGHYSVVRWTAPSAGEYSLSVIFTEMLPAVKADVQVLHNGKPLYIGYINLNGFSGSTSWLKSLSVQDGDIIDFVVGPGLNERGDITRLLPYKGDITKVIAVIKSRDGKVFDAAADFSCTNNPNGVWSYGYLTLGTGPDYSPFIPYSISETLPHRPRIGSLCNPDTMVWEDVMEDDHTYKPVPHTKDIIHDLRTIGKGRKPVFISEYGVGSPVDLIKSMRHYEQIGKTSAVDAKIYAGWLNMFMKDWEQWNMKDTFASPEEYFRQCLAKMASQRTLGINIIRSNPYVIGYSLTGTVDGTTGEGLFTIFREFKPGTVDALSESFAPLHWCLFVEPVHIYRGTAVHLEAVLSNEDALAPGEYPVYLQVVGPEMVRVFERTLKVVIPEKNEKHEPAFALPVFEENVPINGPGGKYRFLVTFTRGAAATGGEIEFYVSDPAEMPSVDQKIRLWGDDHKLMRWLLSHGINVQPFSPSSPITGEVILVSEKAPTLDTPKEFQKLMDCILRGANVIFLSPKVFKRNGDPLGWLPLENKGKLKVMGSWLYLKDDWAKSHPIFKGLPSGGLMDWTFYREIIPSEVLSGQEPPVEAVAGGIDASESYSSGLMVSVYKLGAGHFILNTLRIRENLGNNPAAEYLLRNMLKYALTCSTDEP